ncbi:MAG: YifB family Mg chelatase-like AAA ATPase [Rubrivivax sp.]
MTLAVVRSRALEGMTTREVRVEVHLANGLPGFTLVGLADTEVRESRERVRAALAESGFAFPHNRRVTVNLAPADLPKESGRYDLPMALGILAASGQVDAARLQGCEFAGELSLAGALRPVRGALALALAARRDGCGRALVLPTASARIAARVPDVEVRGAQDLLQVARALAPGAGGLAELPRALPPGRDDTPGAGLAHASGPAGAPDLREVRGQAGARRALEVAAAGAHPMLMIGPPGTGKSMLAQRLPSILPPMAAEQALESAALQGLAGSAGLAISAPFGCRPVRAPHHSASAAALVGGGSPPRPGEISLAHGGVLFLDELPEFPRPALEALREPLETGRVTLSRAGRQAQYPADFLLVAAMNPCPCGWLGAHAATGQACRCTPDAVARYQGRVSGPLLDRIDLVVDVQAQRPEALLEGAPAEDSATVAARVAAARARMLARQGVPNGKLDAAALAAASILGEAARTFLAGAARRLGWSGRAVHRVQKVARTIADLEGAETIGVAHLAEAVQWRRAIEQA